MGLDLEPIIPADQDQGAYWPQLHYHYNWSRFMAIMRIVTYNAVLTKVATDDDPIVVLMRKVSECDRWTTDQCRLVHVLIRKTINASTYGPDPQAAKALAEAQKQRDDFRARALAVLEEAWPAPKAPEAPANEKGADDAEEDSMHVDDAGDDSSAGDGAPCTRLKYPADVHSFWGEDYDALALEFGVTMAVYVANGWGCAFD